MKRALIGIVSTGIFAVSLAVESEPTPREPMPPKAAARFAAAFRALLRSIAIRTVRKPRAVAASVTIKISGTGEENRTRVRVAPSERLAWEVAGELAVRRYSNKHVARRRRRHASRDAAIIPL